MLIRGSFQVHAGMMIYYCSRTKTSEEFKNCYEKAKDIYNQFINDALERLLKNPLALDDTMALQ